MKQTGISSMFMVCCRELKGLEIIYEDNSCIVINKSAGLAVQGGKGIGRSLDSILAETRPQRPFLVHRLDRDTSGLVLVAKTKTAAAAFSRLFTGEGDPAGGAAIPGGKAVIKRYLAVCKGGPPQPEVVIQADLVIRGSVKKSRTLCRLLSGGAEFSLLELELETGRMHQIRRHLAMTGNPVVGDDKYGDFGLNHALRKTMKLHHLLLHASRLIIPQTPDGLHLDLSAPLPGYFQQYINDTIGKQLYF